MFVVLLRFSESKFKAPDFMEGHNAWIRKGVEDGAFIVVGSLQPNAGGAVIVHGMSLTDLEERVCQDPFVAENIVKAEILEITPNTTDSRLEFLQD
ncbi:MAG: hypothetical protein AB2806_04200 [Candidatus Thiodiazotropha sp.]